MDKSETTYSEDKRELMNAIWRKLKFNKRYFKSKELQEELGVSGVKIREAIHNIREAKFPIISNRKGYKWAESPEEINQCVEALWGRAKSMHRAIQGLAESRQEHFPGHVGGIRPETVQESIDKIETETNQKDNGQDQN